MNTKKILYVALAIFLVMVTFASCKKKNSDDSTKGSNASTSGDNSLAALKERKTFVLGLDDSFPPMGYRNEKNEIVGFDIDLAAEVAKRIGVAFKAQPIDWNSKELELSSGNIDCIWNGFTITDERKQQLLFSEPYLVNRQVYVVDSSSGITSDSALAGKKIGVQAGSTGAEAFEKSTLYSKCKVVEYKDFLTALLDLKVGGVDAVVIDSVVAKEQMGRANGKNLKVLEGKLADEQYGIGFRKGDKSLRDEVQRQLDDLKKEGFFAKLADKYGIVL